jgi:hypothetical protein
METENSRDRIEGSARRREHQDGDFLRRGCRRADSRPQETGTTVDTVAVARASKMLYYAPVSVGLSSPSYLPNPKHRDKSPNKSQWTITVADELVCFREADQRAWLLVDEGWGLHLTAGLPAYLGVAAVDQTRKLFIAKFVVSHVPPVWHGYPADPQSNEQDIPGEVILGRWLDSGLLPASKIRKVGKKQACRL